MAESLDDAKTTVKFKKHSHEGHHHECQAPQFKRYTGQSAVEPRGKYDRGTCKHYVSLHHHSTYSYLDGFALPEAHVRRATEVGMSSLALTEHGNISSHVQLEKAAVDQGVKPIFGCEVYMGDDLKTQRKNHLTVLASDAEGYRNLLRLVSRGWEQFYYEPTVLRSDLEEFNEGLIILSGCTGSLVSTSMVGGKNVAPEDASLKRAAREAKWFKKVFGDRYYLEAQAFPELENVRRINEGMAILSKKLEIPLVATGDVHYTHPQESELQKILHNVRGGGRKTLEEMAREWGYDVSLAPPTSDGFMYKRLRATGLGHKESLSAIMSTSEIAGRCNVTLPKMEMIRFPLPPGFETSDELLEAWLKEGWRYRKIAQRPDTSRYVKQLKHELSIIREKDFVDYFLFEADMIRFAKNQDIAVGPGRGSAAASLVCYLLRITEVDPMQFPDLLFERFIDITRKDLPDIDTDFDDDRRGEVLDYLVAKYGREYVGQIGSFTTYKSKLALDDVARVYRIPKYQVDIVKDLLVERSSGDLRASATIEDTAEMFPAAADIFAQWPELGAAMDLEGNVKGMGIHAAGVVISRGPLTDVCATYTREDAKTGEVKSVLSVDKYDAEYLNILKLDNLGLTTLGMIGRTLRMLGKPLSFLYDIPLDDPETIRGFQENDVTGIFQFDGRAMRSVCGELKPDDFLEVALVTALARPGPLHNGASAEYIDIKRGAKKAREYHPLVWPIVKSTKGQIVYQEQILRITGEVGGFDHTHRATIRKIISRKIGEQEFNRWWERFRDGAAERGVDEDSARQVWNSCITAGSYAFNVAHSIGYGMIAWWTMYLKRHHPSEFFVASLQKFGGKPEKRLSLLRDAEAHGLTIYPPDAQESGLTWDAVPGGIRAGFLQVPNIGDVTAQKIIDHRDEFGIKEYADLMQIKGIGPKTVEKMIEFAEAEDPFGIHALDRRIEAVTRAIKRHELGKFLPWPSHKADEIPYSRTNRNVQVVWCGEIIQRNLKELFELHFSRTGEDLDPADVKDPDKNEWVVMLGNDNTELLTITIDRWRYERFREAVWGMNLKDDLVVIRGYKKGNQARRAIYVEDMWVLSESKEESDDE